MESKVNPLDLYHNKFIEEELHDRLIRIIFLFEKVIAKDRVEKTVNKVLRFLPIINSVMTEDPKNGLVWKTRSTTDDIYHNFRDYDYFYTSFVTKEFDEMRQPPIRILHCDDTIAFIVNNTFMDGYAAKHFIAIFFDELNHIDDVAYISELYKSEIRSFDRFKDSIPQAYKVSGMMQTAAKKSGLFSSLLNKLGKSNIVRSIAPSKSPIPAEWKNGFNLVRLTDKPITKDNIDLGFVNELVNRDTTKYLQILAKKYNTTLDNIITTAYMRAIANDKVQYESNICIGRFYNARSESATPNYRSFSNLHVVMPVSTYVGQNTIFHANLNEITSIDNRVLNEHMVAKQILLPVDQIFNELEYYQIVNYGDFPKSFFSLKGNEIVNISFTPSIRNVPYHGLGVAYYDNQIFLSSANFCDEADVELIKNFLGKIVLELKSFIYIDGLIGNKKIGDLTTQAIGYYNDVTKQKLSGDFNGILDDAVVLDSKKYNKVDDTDVLPEKIVIAAPPPPPTPTPVTTVDATQPIADATANAAPAADASTPAATAPTHHTVKEEMKDLKNFVGKIFHKKDNAPQPEASTQPVADPTANTTPAADASTPTAAPTHHTVKEEMKDLKNFVGKIFHKKDNAPQPEASTQPVTTSVPTPTAAPVAQEAPTPAAPIEEVPAVSNEPITPIEEQQPVAEAEPVNEQEVAQEEQPSSVVEEQQPVVQAEPVNEQEVVQEEQPSPVVEEQPTVDSIPTAQPETIENITASNELETTSVQTPVPVTDEAPAPSPAATPEHKIINATKVKNKTSDGQDVKEPKATKKATSAKASKDETPPAHPHNPSDDRPEDSDEMVDEYLHDFADLEKNAELSIDEYNLDPNIVLYGDYSIYKWTPRQIAIAKKYEELTGNIILPIPNDPNSIKYQIKNQKTFQKRKWIDLMKYVHYKILNPTIKLENKTDEKEH